ncbi:cytochrome P450 [Nocardia sp. BMG51109]|uniref:cytochrome P450 n=1 Tax=Nocardia sp. BMG51109 TaxID=1056816 RepID=UPI000565BEB9|nr:cytochrome P450 [Nocardia sp. BMG51109]
MSTTPVSDIDLFTDDARLHPYPLHAELRALGPVVYLSRHDVYALTRYRTIRDVLGDWQMYSSAQGTTMNPGMNADLANVITLFLDPPEHTAVRRVLGRPLRPERLRELAPRIEAEAEAIVGRLVDRGEFDAATELAEHLPMTIVSELVGLGEHGRANMLRWAAATWESQGVPNQRVADAAPVVEEFISFAMTEAVPGKLDPDGWAAQLYEAADAGEVSRDRCPFLMLDYVTPSLDTTIYAVSNAVRLFAEHSEQWDLVRSDPTLIPHAINETLRLESPVQQFTRVVTADHTLEGVDLHAGDRVLVLYGSANRDERKYPDPERFDVTRKPSDHLAFGRGEHVCIGMQLARLEMTALLRSLVSRVRRFEILAAEPVLSNALHGMQSLRVRTVT